MKEQRFTVRTVSGMKVTISAPSIDIARYRAKMQGFQIVGA